MFTTDIIYLSSTYLMYVSSKQDLFLQSPFGRGFRASVRPSTSGTPRLALAAMRVMATWGEFRPSSVVQLGGGLRMGDTTGGGHMMG